MRRSRPAALIPRTVTGEASRPEGQKSRTAASQRFLRRFALASVLTGLLTPGASAQAPSISLTAPQAVAPGSQTDMKLSGGNLAGASELWTSFTASTSLTPDIADNGTKPGEVTWRLAVPPETPVGVHGIRLATPGGASEMKLILVDDLPSVAQAAGNNALEKAQELTLPVAVDGTVASLNHQYFKFKADAGQTVSIETVARRLGSPLDPIIRLLDAAGRELAWSDDESGLGGDARIQHAFAEAGEYFLEIRDIRYQGGGGHFFRLRIGDFPIVATPFPLAVQRGTQAAISFSGHDATAPVTLTIPADQPVDWMNVGAKRPDGHSSGFATLHVTDTPALVETEPNNAAAEATRIELGQSISGRIDGKGDVDHVVFAARKGDKVTVRAVTRRQGAPTSVYLRLLNAAGGQLAAKEDFGVDDASFEQAIPEDGDYTLAIEELHRRGGPEFGWWVEVVPSQTGFDLSVGGLTVNVGAGSTANLTVNANRRGYNGPIQVAAVNLPDGVISQPTVIGPGMKAVELTLTSTTDSPLSRAVPVQVVGTGKEGDRDLRVVATTDDAMKASFAGIPWAPQNLGGQVALGVGPKPQIRLKSEVQEVTFGKQLSATVKVTAERAEGFNEAITLAVTPEANKGGLPGNVTADVKPIAKDQTEAVVTFTATDKAALGDYTVVITGTIKQDKTTVVQTVPGLTLRLTEPMQITVTPATDKVAAGGELKAKVTVQRNPALSGEVVLAFQNLPAGVTIGEAKIPAEQSEIEVTFAVAAEAAKGTVNNISVKGEATVGNAKLAATSPNVALTIE